MRTKSKVLGSTLSLLFFFETTLFYPVRVIASQRQPLPVARSGVAVPYQLPLPEEILAEAAATLEAMEQGGPQPASSIVVPAAQVGADTERVSVSGTDVEADHRSNAPSVSHDGRYVAFESKAHNLVPGDNNSKTDVFVRDRVLRTTTRVSVATSGAEAKGDSGDPAISGDGRYVVFESRASNLVPHDRNKRSDIFVHDRESGATTAITHGDRDSHAPAVSFDGRYIAFESDARNLVAGDRGHRRDIFVYDRDTGEMSLVSRSSSREQGNRDSANAAVSADGRYVTFDSQASNLVLGDTNHHEDVFVHDRETGETTLVSVSSFGEEGDHQSSAPSISGTGRYVAFQSKSRNLVPGLVVTRSSSRDSESDDKSKDSKSKDDDSSDDSDDDSSDDDEGRQDHIYIHDRETGITTLVSQSTDGIPGDKKSSEASIDATGRFVAFASKARNLVSDDTNHKEDVFVRDLARDMTIRASVGQTGEGDKESRHPSISGDGQLVAYESKARNLFPRDTNHEDDVFATELGLNRPPIAVDDAATTLQNTAVDIAVLSNDSDPDGDPLTVESAESLSGASLEILSDGSVRYLPPVDFIGIDTFTYAIRDDHRGTASATVRVEVSGINRPPFVDAGLDQNVVLPASATLRGSVSDDGLPNDTLTIEWTKLSGPDGITIVSPTTAVTEVVFTEAGVYELQLSGNDTEFNVTDTVRVTVEAPLRVMVAVGDATVVEGSGGITEAMVPVTLSRASNQPVSVDYLTFDGSALTNCDYVTRFGTLSFAAGETTKEISIPVVADFAIEPDEGLTVRIGNVLGAEIGDDEGVVTIENDDVLNQSPSPAANRIPANGVTGTAPDPTLSWIAMDPNGDPLTFDVYFGTTFGTDGQTWIEQCSATPGPTPRALGATGLDEEHDRLVLFGGSVSTGSAADVWVLENASGARGIPRWSELSVAPGPVARQQAMAAYDATNNRLIVSGGCSGNCDAVLADTWVLTNANGLGGLPTWEPLPDAPVARRGASGAYDTDSNRLIVFGGRNGIAEQSDLLILKDANGIGTPEWEALSPPGGIPSPRRGAGVGYDSDRNRLVLFGGLGAGDVVTNDVWILNRADGTAGTPQWTKLAPAGTPPAPRWGHVATYEPLADRLLVFGGSGPGFASDTNFVANDVWMLTGVSSSDPTWMQLQPDNGPVPSRLGAQAAYSSFENRLIVISGLNNRLEAPLSSWLPDMWVLDGTFGSLPLVASAQDETQFAASTPAVSDTYFWRVVTEDDRGAAAGAPVFSFRPNASPTVDAGSDQTVRLPNVAQLDASVSDDPLPGGGVSVSWEMVSGPGTVVFGDENAEDTTATFSLPGTYVLRLTANDGELQSTSEVTITVLAPNIAPDVEAGPDQNITLPEQAVTLAASVTDDGVPPGHPVTLMWSSSPTGVVFSASSEAATTATFPGTGVYVLRITASDGELESFDELTVTVIQPNTAPVVEAGNDQATALPSATLTLNGVVIDDGLPANTLASMWSVVSGAGNVTFTDASAPVTDATFDSAGGYTLRLTASDGELSASDDVDIVVGSDALSPDLTVDLVDTSALVVDPQTLTISGTLAAVIGNSGVGPAAGPFEVTFFEDLNRNGSFDPFEDNIVAVGSYFGIDTASSAVVTASASPTALSFSGNLIYAFADSSLVVDESNEANNLGSSAATCDVGPFSTAWNVQAEWVWTGSQARPDSDRVLMTPAVIDLDKDGTPEVLFTAFEISSLGGGFLTVINGRTGEDAWQVTAPEYRIYPLGQLAVGDIDLDGLPEILAVHETAFSVIAFEHDGTFKWQSPRIDNIFWGGPSIADIDADGVPEIVAGRQVLNNDGTLRWTGSAGAARVAGLLSLVVDLDDDGLSEIVAGNTVYRYDGTILWQLPFPDGLNAVGQFDDDPFPEIVLVQRGTVTLIEHDGTLKWGPIAFPTGTAVGGGPPVAADFDGDGFDEIGIAGSGAADRYFVFDDDGALLWEGFTEENSLGNASSAFDFDGDGTAEVVYSDSETLRIRRGHDGLTLFETPMGSDTAYETAIAADVDGDGEAEVLAVSDNISVTDPPSGVWAFGERSGLWSASRPIYNQHQYHVTNINDDGTIPAPEIPAWREGLGFRNNAFAGVGGGTIEPGCRFAKPDLTGSSLRMTANGTHRELTVRVGNGGENVAAAGVPVSFYDGDPSLGGIRLGTARTSRQLAPGEFEDVTSSLPLELQTTRSVWVSVDDFGGLVGGTSESDEDNNVFDSGLALLGASSGQPDLVVVDVDTTSVTGDWQSLAIEGVLAATVGNQGDTPVGVAFEVTFFEDSNGNRQFEGGGTDQVLAVAILTDLESGASARVEAAASGSLRFRDALVYAFVDSADVVLEANETNNVGASGNTCRFFPNVSSFELETEWSWTASPILPAFTQVMSTPVVADLDDDGISDVVFSSFAPTNRVNAHLRAVSGRDGSELFTVESTTERVRAESNLAVGDIDGDGRPEILALDTAGRRLRAFEHDGSLKWASDALLDPMASGALSLADLEGDGSIEILAGRHVLDADGNLLWTGVRLSKGESTVAGPMSLAVDLDLDGRLEVLAGNVAYEADGTLRWENTDVGDGLTAIGNFDEDDFPEIVHIRGNNISLLDHTGERIWGPVRTGLGILGPPTIADFDADGRPEIATASRDELHLVETSGYVRWSLPVSHSATVLNGGAAVSTFDFNGDGAFELVYLDDSSLRIYEGSSGNIIGETTEVESCHYARAMAAVADVDGDGDAELIATANAACSDSDRNGVFVLGESNGNFVSARPIWNQHGYHVTNVEDDASLPMMEAPSWLRNNTYRAQLSGGGSPFAAPDLTVSFVRRAEDGADLVFTVRIGNSGAGNVASGVPISVYNGDPRLGFPLLDTFETAEPIGPGELEDVEFRITSFTPAVESLHFVVDDLGGLSGTIDECHEDNNVHDSGFFLNRPPTVESGEDAFTAFPNPELPVSATVSDDGLPLGEELRFTWGGRGGPSDLPVFFDDRTALDTVARFPTPGLFTVGMNVTDGALVAVDNFLVQVDTENHAPSVDAGPDVIVERPNDTATLTGIVDDDGLPSNGTLSVVWTQISGPASVVFSAPTSTMTTAVLPETGDYVLRLTADDGSERVSDELTVFVTPPNQAPQVSAGPDETIFSPSTLVSGTVSDDGLPSNGTLVTSWSVVSGPGVVLFEAPGALASRVRFGAAGDYVLRLTAEDGALSSFDEVTITVDVTNVAPVVNAGQDQTILLPAVLTTLGGSVTDDGLPLGGSLSVVWNLLSGPGPVIFGSRFQQSTAVELTAAGIYVFELLAGDGELEARDQVEVFVDDGNVAPVVNAGTDQTIALPTNQISLAGAADDDGKPAGATLEFTWSQVSGPGIVSFGNPSSASTTATFEADGEYVLQLSVTDTRLIGTDELTVTVEPAPPGPPPTVAIITPTERQGVSDFTDVVGTVESPDLLSWKLEVRQEGTDVSTRVGSGQTEVTGGLLGTLDPSLLMNGLYEIRLSATDNAGQTAVAQVFVVVKENLKVGHFTLSFVDLEVPVAGLPIRVTRTYDSRDKRQGDFGFGWRMDLSAIELSENKILGQDWDGQRIFGGLGQYCIAPGVAGVVTVTLPGGEVLEFEPFVQPTATSLRPCTLVPLSDAFLGFRPLPGTHGSLEPVDVDHFVYVIGSFPGTVQLFDSSFRLYDPQVYRLTLPDGRSFVIDQEEGLVSLRDLNGNELTVTDDGITHSSGIGIVFERDDEGRILSITDPNGNPMFYDYDTNGDLVRFRDREDHPMTFTYLTSVPHHLDGIEDSRGLQPIRNEYDPDTGRLLRHTDAFGKTIEYTHGLGTRQEEVVDRNGALRVLEYDARGNVVRETDPLGNVVLRSFDTNDNRTCESESHHPSLSGPDCESSPNPTLFTYDARDNLLSQTDPDGNITSFTYNDRDQVETTTDPLGKVTTNVYDAQGNLTKTTDPAGNETNFTYDVHGNVKTQTVHVGGVEHVTRFDYDGAGRVTRETDPAGHVAEFTYDLNGNRLTETRTRTLPNLQQETLLTRFVYNKLGRLVKTIDPDGSTTTTVYDAIGKQKESIDKLGRKTTFEYDEMGQLVKTTFPDGTTETSTYDAEGRRLTSTDRENRTTSFEYDALGRLVKTTFPDATFTQNIYDEAGRLESSIDARGKATRFQYDDAGRRTAVTDPLGNRTEFTYDANGNQITVKDPNGEVTRFEYDDLNRRTKTIFPDLTFIETAYDALGRRVRETDQAGIVTGFEYDELGRLTKVVQDVNGLALETTYEYDEVGNRIAQTDANGHTTRFEYDVLGRETKRVFPDGIFEEKAYDTVGNLTAWRKFDGSVVAYQYDVNHRLIRKDFPTGTDVAFTYTASGRRRTVTDARGTTSYDYDVRDRVKTLSYPDGSKLDYSYDENGNRTSLTATVGASVLTTSYSYDDANRLDVVTDPNGLPYDHDYDANGNRAALSYPNGVNTVYQYDTLNRLTDLTTTGPTGTIQSYQFTLGPAGNRKRIDEADGTSRAYDYDSLYRLTQETVTDALANVVYEKSFAYDPVGNRETQTTTGLGAAFVDYTYDSRDRLLTENGTTYGYDANGNLTSKSGEATYTWDFEDRLIRVEKTDGTVVTHAYDADGNRVRTEVTPSTGPPEVTNFLVDPIGMKASFVEDTDETGEKDLLTLGFLSEVVVEYGASGEVIAKYVRGSDLLAVIRDSATRYYHADGNGSIRLLTDELANVTDTYLYTAFGEPLGHSGQDVQPYRFIGEPFDPNTNFQYHRARWMDPATGRFVSQDTFRGLQFDPQSLHRYTYASASPTNRVDPTGLVTLPEAMVSLQFRVTIAVTNFSQRLALAFGTGGVVLGRLFQEIGRFAQNSGTQVLLYYQRLRPAFQISLEQRAGRRILDAFVRLGDRSAWIEMKYALPRVTGSALTRLIDQVNSALAAGEGQVVLWSLRPPGQQQVRLVLSELGAAAGRVQLVHGVEGLWRWLGLYFGQL